MSRLISQLRHNITKYNLLLWQLRGATGGGQTDFVLQDKSDFVLTCIAFLMHTCYQVC